MTDQLRTLQTLREELSRAVNTPDYRSVEPSWHFIQWGNNPADTALLERFAEPRFGEIDVALNAAQNLIVDHPLVAELEQGRPLDLESLASQLLVVRRIQSARPAGMSLTDFL